MEEECAEESGSYTQLCDLRLVGETGCLYGTVHEETHCVRGHSFLKKKDVCDGRILQSQRSLESCA